ncbi:hypothetical protein SAMN04490202_0659 [Pseudomonas reinekei]|uniref:Uncharacterized protein n=1 Tax=Pseudomonas reinekei TaxID=395598 RepID=A0A1H0IWF5_PSERE|nr:hypothetical protein [Pseudomonas reinekei]KAB0480893.1 hypothetical protein F7R15_27060 [Pseudomonas reinekei]OLT99422.1 hypothetical protein BVK86_26325 [Pseudomonas reinekei]SDO35560.1 hypothetical protein SAMN04490202_0659 [Pseudomonas reinekei]
MTDQPLQFGTYQWFEETSEKLPLDPSEIEVRLAIAEFVIRRVAGTPAGEDIFIGLIKLFENRYPHHKLLSHYLISPGCLVPEAEDVAAEHAAEDISLGFGELDKKLRDNLVHPAESLEPSGPLAGANLALTPRGRCRRKK